MSNKLVSIDVINNYKYFTDEVIFKQLCHEIIDNMPMEDLCKLFNCNKIDPYSNEIRSKISHNEIPEYEIEEIKNLIRIQQIKYSADLKIEK
jgi:hypothetical protein